MGYAIAGMPASGLTFFLKIRLLPLRAGIIAIEVIDLFGQLKPHRSACHLAIFEFLSQYFL